MQMGEVADAVIINTCTVTENADIECRKIIRRAKRSSPNAFIGVTGCYAQLQPEAIASIDGVNAVFGAQEKFDIPRYVENRSADSSPEIFVQDLPATLDFHSAYSADSDSRTRAFLKLQDGCDYSCSFCTIPLARGASRSLGFRQIESQLQHLARSGYDEVVLTGINLGEYRSDSGETFSDVVKMIAELRPPFRVRISSIEPNKLKPEIIETVATSEVFCKSFHIPLQSGSPEILRLMKRRYKQDHYRELVANIKSLIPDCAIGADVITGFPGEGEVEFQETVNFIESLPISYLHAFTYSERADTPAKNYENPVTVQLRRQRTKKLRLLSTAKQERFYKEQIGSTRKVIAERHLPDENVWVGYTENYVRVKFPAPEVLVSRNIEVNVVSAEPEFVRGELASLPAIVGSHAGYIALNVVS